MICKIFTLFSVQIMLEFLQCLIFYTNITDELTLSKISSHKNSDGNTQKSNICKLILFLFFCIDFTFKYKTQLNASRTTHSKKCKQY